MRSLSLSLLPMGLLVGMIAVFYLTHDSKCDRTKYHAFIHTYTTYTHTHTYSHTLLLKAVRACLRALLSLGDATTQVRLGSVRLSYSQ